MRWYSRFSVGLFLLGASACGTSSSGGSGSNSSTSSGTSGSATFTGLAIVGAGGSTVLSAVPGDALALDVVETYSDHSTRPLASGATVEWTGPSTAIAVDAGGALFEQGAASPIPSFGPEPTAVFIDNPGRPTDLSGLLFVLDDGSGGQTSLSVSATVTGVPDAGQITASVSLNPSLVGSVNNGATVFAARCAACHGLTGGGSAPDAGVDGGGYVIAGKDYPYPAPGLNDAQGHVASFSSWNGAVLAMAARSDMNLGGFTMFPPMPNFYKADGGLSTQDFQDIYSWLLTQSQ